MKNLKKLTFLSAICALVGGAAASAHPVTSPATVYAGPGHQWGVIAQIPAGADVRVLGCYGGWEQGWCKVRYGAVRGYVEGGVLAPSRADQVIVAPVATADQAALRKGPGVNWEVVRVLEAGEIVNVGQCVRGWRGRWCRVTADDATGWVRASLLQRQGAIFD